MANMTNLNWEQTQIGKTTQSVTKVKWWQKSNCDDVNGSKTQSATKVKKIQLKI